MSDGAKVGKDGVTLSPPPFHDTTKIRTLVKDVVRRAEPVAKDVVQDKLKPDPYGADVEAGEKTSQAHWVEE